MHEVELVNEEPLGVNECLLDAAESGHVRSALTVAHNATVAAFRVHLSQAWDEALAVAAEGGNLGRLEAPVVLTVNLLRRTQGLSVHRQHEPSCTWPAAVPHDCPPWLRRGPAS